MELPKRKHNRLKNHNYSENGSYFITVCVKDRRELLSSITVGTGVLDCPKIQLSRFGEIADRYIRQLNDFYDEISVDKYIIMPDHIHFILSVNSAMQTSAGNQNSVVAKFVGTFKRFCNKEYGENIWQARYYDHVIRNEQDHNEVWEYIENNPLSWILKNQGE